MLVSGREYSVIMGFDRFRDGMFLELYFGSGPRAKNIAEWFYSEVG
jgi:hypothetical protein